MRVSTSRLKPNPFPGLRPFTQEEDYLFFGREEQTLELLARLGRHRFVAVVGTSGSGKSSLVRCGLLSELLGGKMLGAGASWEIAITHPGGNPLGLLTEALLDADLYDREQESTRENLLATLSRSHFGLVEAVKQGELGEDANFLLVVDQFEEIFRFHEAGQKQQEAASEFVSLLLEAAAQKEVPIYVVLTMRSDFIGECGQFEGLAEMVNRGEFLIPRLTREQYKRVIEGPIKVAGGQIAPRLLQRLLNDLGQEADQLPCLQHALMRTWTVWVEKGDHDALDLDDYQRVGKMTQALSLHADEIYDALPTNRHRDLCRGLFQALTVQESENRGIRRPQRLGRLCQILNVGPEELVPIINAYRQPGVTFLMPGAEVELTDRTIIDISHESLMRVWARLRRWVEEEAQAAGIYLRLSESAALYEQKKAGLYRDPELGIALAWQESQQPNAAWAERYRPGFEAAMAFLAASRQASVAEEQAREAGRQHELEQARQLAEAQQLRLEQQRRSARKLRQMIAGLAAVAVIAVLACGAALLARNEASRLADVAEHQAVQARQNEDKARRSQQETANALAVVETQKAAIEESLSKAEAAEEAGRKLLYTTDMQLAPFVWRDDRATAWQLRRLLAKHIPDRQAAALKPDLRGFEWHYYKHLLDSSAAVFSGHAVPVAGSAFTANGQLVTLDQNGQVRHWNLESQEEDKSSRHDLPGGAGAQVRTLSPNGRLAALAERNKAHVFDTSTGKEQFQIDSAPERARRLIFTPDSSNLVIVDDRIRWCDAVSGEVIASLRLKFDRVNSLALSADGLTLAVAGQGRSAQDFSIFRLDGSTRKVTLQARGTGPTMTATALSPDGRVLAANYPAAGMVVVSDTRTGRRIAQHGSAHASAISALTFSGVGYKLVTADVEGTIRIWEDARKLTSKSSASLTLKGHEAAITHVGFSSSGKQLVSTSADKTARVWDMESIGAAIRAQERAGKSGKAARFSPDGHWIAGAEGRSVRLWDAATGKLVRELPGSDKGRVCSVAFSPTDNRLLAVGYGGQADVSYVSLWDFDAEMELARLPGATDLPDFRLDRHNGLVGALAFSPDGKYLIAGFGGENFSPTRFSSPVKVWEVASRRLIRLLGGHTGYCSSLDFSRDGKVLASGSHDGTAILWSVESWKAIRTLRNPDPGWAYSQAGAEVRDVACSPDGKTLALASRAGTVQLWAVGTGKLLATLKGHSSAVNAVAFSPDGRTLASGGTDHTVRLWNVETRRELMQLDSANVELGQVQALAFSPDGKHLLAGGDRIAVWYTEPLVWNDPDGAAEKLRWLLQSNADFRSRIRMLSENLRLHAALAKLDAKDVRVQAALAATRANLHAAQQRWPEAVREIDRLLAIQPSEPAAWLGTRGLLRLARALLHQDRPADAAMLLQGGAKRRAQDALPATATVTRFGFRHVVEGGALRIVGLESGSPASRSNLRVGDVIVKVNGIELTAGTIPNLATMFKEEVGTKVRLTVRHPGGTQTEDVDLVKESYRLDEATGELLFPLLAMLEKRLSESPRDAGLLELRAELAGQANDFARQVADCTAAIDILADQPTEAVLARLRRLHRRRGDVHVSLQKWQEAVDDYAQVITPETTDGMLLSNRARAHEALKNWDAAAADWSRAATGIPDGAKQLSELARRLVAVGQGQLAMGPFEKAQALYERLLAAAAENDLVAAELAQLLLDKSENDNRARWTVLEPTEMKSEGGATLRLRSDGSILASGKNPERDVCTLVARPGLERVTAIRLEALPDPSLPSNGPGRSWNGNFHLNKLCAFSGGAQVPLTKIDAFYHELPELQTVIDGKADSSMGWGNNPRAGKTNTALVASRLQRAPADELKIELHFSRAQWTHHNLGCFRLSVSGDPTIFAREQQRFAAMKLTDPRLKLIAAYAVDGRTNQALAHLSTALKGADGYEGSKPIFEVAGLFDDLLSALSKRRPDDPQLQLAMARKLAERGKQHLLEKQPGKAQAELEKAREMIERLLSPAGRWTVLPPIEMKTDSGAKMELQKDGSIFVHQHQSARNDTYSLVFQSEGKGITGLRLEVLPDSRLPRGGPGWAGDGNFVLNELTLLGAPTDSPDTARPIALRNASADFSQRNWDVRGAVDGDAATGWAVSPETNKAHTAVFEVAEQAGDGRPSRLTFRLKHHYHAPGYTLGRFRLSFTNDATTVQATRHRLDLKDGEVVELHIALAKAHAQQGQTKEAVASLSAALPLAADRAGKARIVAEAASLKDVLEALAERAADDAQFQAELARHLAARGNLLLAIVQFEKARALYERSEVAGRENDLVATELSQLLYDSARAAALAAAGQDRTEPRPDDTTKATLRRQALTRLNAARTALTRPLTFSPRNARMVIVKTLIDWQHDSDLAGIRDESALAKLPAEEQKAFTRLWADLAKSVVPASPAECLELAQHCKSKKLYQTAAGLYASAFAADPRLVTDVVLGHRYNAACYAALAAAGQSVEAAKVDDKERLRLRKQALNWLRADLALRGERLETGNPADRATLQQKMLHWQNDIDLAGVRDKSALARLPDEEQKEWTQLWTDVAALLTTAQEKPKQPR
jgi:WD40 repeat protein